MSPESLRRIVPRVALLLERTGATVLEYYHPAMDVSRKADASLTTPADHHANALLRDGLARLQPDLPIVSEESAAPVLAERRRWQRYWLVDPLDGTREFVRRSDQFTINVALVEDHRPILGLVYAPVTRRLWYGGPGLGAFRVEPGGEPRAVRTVPQAREPLRVILGHGSPGPRTRATLARLPEHRTTREGASLKFCAVAEGRADLFPRYGEIAEWDMAAPQAILEGAGGTLAAMSDLAPLRYNTRESLVTRDIVAFADRSIDWRRYLRD